MQDILRTPEERFDDLPGFSCESCTIDHLKGFEGLRYSTLCGRHCLFAG